MMHWIEIICVIFDYRVVIEHKYVAMISLQEVIFLYSHYRLFRPEVRHNKAEMIDRMRDER